MDRLIWWKEAYAVFLLCVATAIAAPAQTFTSLLSFDGTDGGEPIGGLVQATNGNLYGMTYSYGPTGGGTVFKITPGGTLTTLHAFDGADGGGPQAGLIQATDGVSDYGTIFRITPRGMLTTLYSFCGCTDGSYPQGLVQATDGNFYGTTIAGGTNGGTVFAITPSGSLTTLYTFCSQSGCTDGQSPDGELAQDTNGNFYGTTAFGGTSDDCEFGCGTVFSLSTGLGPFVSFVRNPAKVGQTFGILGQGLNGTTGVLLDGAPATFIVKSDTLLEATVPAGATTGPVTVTTPSGTLTSNVPFRVLPQLFEFQSSQWSVGTQVTITGVSLTQTTGVGFGDQVPANFTVISDTQVTASVPQGAVTGKVGIETQGGTAISSAIFTVTQ